jgi:hypothetical protein
MMQAVAKLGAAVVDGVVKLGYGARLFALLLAQSGTAFRRLRLTIAQTHFIGNYSLVIIVVSGLFVGFVLGLQGYNTLQRYGSEQALGLLVALSLVRELGPVITALLFAGRAGTSITDEGRRATVGDGNDGGVTHRSCAGAAVLGRCDLDAAVGGDVFCRRCGWWLRRRCGADRRRRRFILESNAGRRRLAARRRQRRGQEHRIWHCRDLHSGF